MQFQMRELHKKAMCSMIFSFNLEKHYFHIFQFPKFQLNEPNLLCLYFKISLY